MKDFDIKIERGAPPVVTSGSFVGDSRYRNTLQGMKIGEWFIIPKKTRSSWMSARSAYMKRGQIGIRNHETDRKLTVILRKAD